MSDFVNSGIVEKSKEKIFKKKGIGLIKEIKFEKIKEGKCVQILHTGAYSTGPESLERMRKLKEQKNPVESGFHHEVYLSDPRKVAPEKMKTILRQPVK